MNNQFNQGLYMPPSNQGVAYQNITTTEIPYIEQSYIENILRQNKGKKVKVYQTFPDASEWRDKVFEGIIEQSGRDHIVLSDPITGMWYLLYMIYVDYVEFMEPINYKPQFPGGKLEK